MIHAAIRKRVPVAFDLETEMYQPERLDRLIKILRAFKGKAAQRGGHSQKFLLTSGILAGGGGLFRKLRITARKSSRGINNNNYRAFIASVVLRSVPSGAVNKDLEIDRQSCRGCGRCVASCPQKALSLSGKARALEEVTEICLQDRAFYEESGGGVTFSGGEVLSQASFAARLLDALHGSGIHCTLETSGLVRPETFIKLANRTDLFLFDIKHHNQKRHLEITGVNNDVIMTNLKYVLEKGIEILPRIPVIPGFNNSSVDAEEFAALFRNLGLKKVQLLPFHQFGEKKYEMLRRPYPLKGKVRLYKEDLHEYRRILTGHGLDCFF